MSLILLFTHCRSTRFQEEVFILKEFKFISLEMAVSQNLKEAFLKLDINEKALIAFRFYLHQSS
jgi:hypothetical protein